MGVCAGARGYGIPVPELFIQQRITLLGQFFKFLVLLIDAVGYAFFVLRPGSTGGLFDELPDIVLKDRDAIIEF
jgi:hypothetical protein